MPRTIRVEIVRNAAWDRMTPDLISAANAQPFHWRQVSTNGLIVCSSEKMPARSNVHRAAVAFLRSHGHKVKPHSQRAPMRAGPRWEWQASPPINSRGFVVEGYYYPIKG
jgi:hypothetical protein